MFLTIKSLIEKYNTFLKYSVSAGLAFGRDLGMDYTYTSTGAVCIL